MEVALKEATRRKQNGIHYTPPRLARFLAEQTVRFMDPDCDHINVLDPACGDGALLASLLNALPLATNGDSVTGFDTNPEAVKNTFAAIAEFELKKRSIRKADFLQYVLEDPHLEMFDCVIANPPYVRTQVLGGTQSRQLAKKFGLTGRIDLYQAFAFGISQILRPGGVMGLLTSNRFLTVKAGMAMREMLTEHFEVRAIFDLGDTKIFDAAVLPVVLIAIKKPCRQGSSEFNRVYTSESADGALVCDDVLDGLTSGISGVVQTATGCFRIERGALMENPGRGVWSLSNDSTRNWLSQVRSMQVHRFGDVAEIRVGIKSTADKVFIKEDWNVVHRNHRPEPKAIFSLLTHHDARRWSADGSTRKTVLYPYELNQVRRTVIKRSQYPKTFSYLESHRELLESRKYVTDSGRQWFEIWVPHQPMDWAQPKIVWPDIADQPRFFLDSSQAIVNGDCYWIKLREGVEPSWLYMMLAVANSSVAIRFYDTIFHNKLYAGRRRFMTQYVKEFPLPDIRSATGAEIVAVVKQLVVQPSKRLDSKCEQLVCSAFGL